MFDRALRHICLKGICTYQTKYQLCAFRFPDGQPCKAVRPTHPQHCSSDEKGSTSPGTFDSANYPEAADSSVRRLEQTFINMFKDLCSRTADESGLRLPPLPEFTQYRRQTLASDKLRQCGFWHTAKSNKTCFACLQSVPDHSLPCGHVLCEQCVKDFGKVYEDERNCTIISQCLFCFAEWPSQLQLVRFKPKLAGVRVLTLDGGGIRGIVELEILAEVERRVGLGVPIRDLFDLVVGTSTGE